MRAYSAVGPLRGRRLVLGRALGLQHGRTPPHCCLLAHAHTIWQRLLGPSTPPSSTCPAAASSSFKRTRIRRLLVGPGHHRLQGLGAGPPLVAPLELPEIAGQRRARDGLRAAAVACGREVASLSGRRWGRDAMGRGHAPEGLARRLPGPGAAPASALAPAPERRKQEASACSAAPTCEAEVWDGPICGPALAHHAPEAGVEGRGWAAGARRRRGPPARVQRHGGAGAGVLAACQIGHEPPRPRRQAVDGGELVERRRRQHDRRQHDAGCLRQGGCDDVGSGRLPGEAAVHRHARPGEIN